MATISSEFMGPLADLNKIYEPAGSNRSSYTESAKYLYSRLWALQQCWLPRAVSAGPGLQRHGRLYHAYDASAGCWSAALSVVLQTMSPAPHLHLRDDMLLCVILTAICEPT